MKRRDGSSLVEVLIALGILVSGLLVAYILLQNSFMGFRRLDRRQTAEAISLNIQDRYFHTESTELIDKFGSPSGGRATIEEDALVLQTLPVALPELKKLGFQIDAFAVGLDQGSGSTGVYFTTKVSWPATGGRQFVTHSRVVASGLRPAQLVAMADAPAPTPAAAASTNKLLALSVAGNVEAYGSRATAVEQALAGKGRTAPLVFQGNAKVLDAMAVQAPAAREGAAASEGAARGTGGAGGAARGGTATASGSGAGNAGFKGGSGSDGAGSGGSGFGLNAGGGGGAASWDDGGASGASSASRSGGHASSDGATVRSRGANASESDWDDSAEVITVSGVERKSRGGRAYASGTAESPAEARAARRKALAGEAPAADAPGGAQESELLATTADPIDFLLAAAPQLTAEERARLVPGKATTEAELAKLWAPLESRRVPPGIYRYNTQSYIHVTTTKVFRYELLTLQAEGSSEKFPLLSRRELTGGQVSGAYLEGAEVLERRMLAVRGVAPGGPTVAAGVSAILERTPERLYVTRPVLLPDGSVAPFGREIAVLAWEGSEAGEVEGAQGKKAREDISKQWVLGELEPAAAKTASAGSSAANPVAASFAAGSYSEKVETPRARAGEVEDVGVTWASNRSRNAPPSVEANAPSWKSRTAYAEALEAINKGELKTARTLLEQLRSEAGTPRIELERLYASVLVQMEHWDEAAEVYATAAKNPDADASLHNNLAFVEMHRGNAAGALAAASAALQKDPGHLTAAVNAGLANEMLGKRDEAINAYQAGLAAHPNAASLLEGLRRMGATDK